MQNAVHDNVCLLCPSPRVMLCKLLSVPVLSNTQG